MEKKQKADKFCEKIFLVLMITKQEIRFNDLYRKLLAFGVKMTKPTLIKHLNHLQKDEIIKRNEKEKQKVTYSLNWKKFEQTQTTEEIKQLQSFQKENEQIFKSKSIDHKVIYVATALTKNELFHLKTRILGTTEPENKPQHYLTYALIHGLYNTYTKWLLDTCKESEENTQKIIKSIDKCIGEFDKLLYQLRPELPNKKEAQNQLHN